MLMSGALAGTIVAGGAGAVPVGAASWGENADYIFDYLTNELEYSEAAACGIMANIRCESTFNPHAWNAGGGSYGLCQWTGGRYGRLQSWCRSNGFDYTTIDGQLAYLEYELENHYPGVENYLRSVENTSDGAYNAGQYYCYHFEAPASRGSVSVYRGGLASGTFWESYRPAEWYKVDGVWHYILRDGSYQTDWLTIDNDTFYFDQDGNRISGWRTIDGQRYFFEEDGTMATGWKKIDGRSFYFDSDGSLITGILHSGEDWYLLDEYGSVQASAAMEEYAPAWIAANPEEETDVALASADSQDSSSDAVGSGLQENGQEADEPRSGQAFLSSSVESGRKENAMPFALASADKQETGSGQASSVEMLRRAAMALEENTDQDDKENEKQPAEADDYLAAAEAMQAASLSQEQEPEEEESAAVTPTASEAPFQLPSSALELAGTLPELSNEPIRAEELQDLPAALAANSGKEDPEEPEGMETDENNSLPTPAAQLADHEDFGPFDIDNADHDSTADSLGNDESNAPDRVNTDSASGNSGTGASGNSESEDKTESTETAVTNTGTASEKEKHTDEADSFDDSRDSSVEQTESREEDVPVREEEQKEEDKSRKNDKDDKYEKDSSEEQESGTGASSAVIEDSKEIEDSEESVNFNEADGSDDTSGARISLSELESERLQNEDGDADLYESDRVVIILDQEKLPTYTKEDLEDPESIVDDLRERKILQAVTGSGLDITPEVTATVKPSEEEEDAYMITFEAIFGDSRTELTTVVTVGTD